MANEISLSLSLQVRKNNIIAAMQTGSLGIAMLGNNQLSNIQEVGDIAEQIDLGDVLAAQLLALRHVGDAGTIAISLQADGSNPFATLSPAGPPLLLPTPAAIIYAKASVGTIPMAVVAAEP